MAGIDREILAMKAKTRGIIAAGHTETARAGAAMFAEGGNAFDAALAAMLVSFVAEPALTSLGGGGFMTAVQANGKPFTLDFFVQTPQKKQPITAIDLAESVIDFGTTVQPQYIGRGTVATPGCPAGVAYIHRHFCTLPLSVIAAPAIRLAREGCPLSVYQQYTLDIIGKVLSYTPEARTIFCKENSAETLKAGDICRNLAFADALEHLCKYGFEDFYTGEMGEIFAKDSRENGGSVHAEDLRAFRAEVRQPLHWHYRGSDFYTNPRPSTGGSLIAHGLAHWTKSPAAKPTGAEYVRSLAHSFRDMERFRTEGMNPLGNTTHFSIMDEFGNAVGITTSQGGVSGVCLADTGISLNNMLGELDLSPNGLYSWSENERVSSMMSPSLILKNGKPMFVLGSGGSSRIRTAIVQVVVQLLHFETDIETAVAHSRMHWQGGTMNLEPNLLAAGESAEGLKDVAENIILWQEQNMYFGGVHTVAQTPNGDLIAAADSRRDGHVA